MALLARCTTAILLVAALIDCAADSGVLIIEARRDEVGGHGGATTSCGSIPKAGARTRGIHAGAAEFSPGVAGRSDRSASQTAAWSRHLAGDLDAARIGAPFAAITGLPPTVHEQRMRPTSSLGGHLSLVHKPNRWSRVRH